MNSNNIIEEKNNIDVNIYSISNIMDEALKTVLLSFLNPIYRRIVPRKQKNKVNIKYIPILIKEDSIHVL